MTDFRLVVDIIICSIENTQTINPGSGNIAVGIGWKYCNSLVDAQVHYYYFFYCEVLEHLPLSSPVLPSEIYSPLCDCSLCLLPEPSRLLVVVLLLFSLVK